MASGVLRTAKRTVERPLVRYLHRFTPHGLHLFCDLRTRVPSLTIETVFDVGANVGQSARKFRRNCPSARIYSFEPFRSTFEQLRENTRPLANVECVNLALGSESGEVTVAAQPQSVSNSLRAGAGRAGTGAAEVVRVETLDGFCAGRGIERIDLLKIDTEGYDLEVLRGAEGMLRAGRISLIEVEAGMSRRNSKHVPLADFVRHLEGRGFVLFGVYDQTPEWNGDACLRFSNPVFIAERLVQTSD
jgi:FkbM family methyltransferase